MNINEVKFLIDFLNLTLSGNQQSINKAEQVFNEISKSPTFLESLFKITMKDNLTDSLKLAASSLLYKNTKNSINFKDCPYNYNLIQANIVDAITYYFDKTSTRKNLEDTLSVLVTNFYPIKWPDLLNILVSKIKEADEFRSIYGALRAIYSIFTGFKLKLRNKKNPIQFLMEKIFPYLENIALRGLKNMDDNFVIICHLILKIFHSAVYLGFEEYINNKTLKIWLFILKMSWECNFGIEKFEIPTDWDMMYNLEKNSIFLLKTEALEIIQRITLTLNNKKTKYEDLFDFYITILPPILDSILIYNKKIIDCNQNCVYSNKCVAEIYKILFYSFQINEKLEIANEKSLLTPELIKRIIYDIAIYHFQISKFEEQFFLEDNNQYIYSDKNMLNEPVMVVKQFATDILLLLVKYDSDILKMYLNFTENILKGNNIRNKNNCDDRLKEGILFGVEHCIDYIKDDLNKEMDEFIQKILLPGLLSDNIFLKARVCSIIYNLTECEIRNMDLLVEICKEICKSMTIDNLLLKIKAIKALSIIITIPDAQKLLKNDLEVIVNTILNLMKIINLDDLLISLKSIVLEFQDEIKPFAKTLVTNLLETFWDIAKNSNLNNDDTDEIVEENQMIDGLESTLITIIQILCCNLTQEFYLESKIWLLDIIAYIFTNKNVMRHLFDYGLELLSIYVYKLDTYDDNIYFLFPIICYTIVGRPKNKSLIQNLPPLSETQKNLLFSKLINEKCCYHNQIFDKYLGILGNFIQKGYKIIFNAKDFYGKRLLEYIFDIIDFLTTRGLNDNIDLDLIYAVKILGYLFENNFNYLIQNQIHIFEEINRYLYNYLKQERGYPFRSIIYQKFCLMLYSDNKLVLDLWKKQKIYQDVLYGIFGNLDLFEDNDEKQTLLLAMIALYKLNPEDFPKIIPLNSLVQETLNTMIFFVENQEKKKNFCEEEVEVDKNDEYDDDDQSWNEEDHLDEEDHDLNYEDPFDKSEPILELNQIFRTLEKNNPTFFFRIMNELSKAQKDQLLDCFNYFLNQNN